MSILIKDMKMPESCSMCLLMVGTFCDVLEIDVDPFYDGANKRHASCPLVELPEKHGRLVDADALHVLFENQWHYLQCLNWDENPKAEEKQTGIKWCINTLHDDAPTIIEAEGE